MNFIQRGKSFKNSKPLKRKRKVVIVTKLKYHEKGTLLNKKEKKGTLLNKKEKKGTLLNKKEKKVHC